jgi:hypothetical protein
MSTKFRKNRDCLIAGCGGGMVKKLYEIMRSFIICVLCASTFIIRMIKSEMMR